jgi:hypothetical protein
MLSCLALFPVRGSLFHNRHRKTSIERMFHDDGKRGTVLKTVARKGLGVRVPRPPLVLTSASASIRVRTLVRQPV